MCETTKEVLMSNLCVISARRRSGWCRWHAHGTRGPTRMLCVVMVLTVTSSVSMWSPSTSRWTHLSLRWESSFQWFINSFKNTAIKFFKYTHTYVICFCFIFYNRENFRCIPVNNVQSINPLVPEHNYLRFYNADPTARAQLCTVRFVFLTFLSQKLFEIQYCYAFFTKISHNSRALNANVPPS